MRIIRIKGIDMKNLKVKLIATLLLAACLSLFAGAKVEESSGLSIVATTNMVTDVVQQIAGDRIDIYGLIPQGQDPHGYELTPRDMARVEKADLIFVNGFDLEENLLTALENVAQGRIVALSASIEPIQFEEEDHHEGEEDHHEGEEHHHDVDPHTWMSLINVISWTEVAQEALTEIDPSGKDYYALQADEYREQLLALHKEATRRFAPIPEEKRVLIVDHNVFEHLARDYDFHILGALIPGFSSNAEPSPAELAGLVEEIEEYSVPAVFMGNTASDGIRRLGEVLKKELDSSVKVIPLLTGSLAPMGEPGDSYLDFFRYNMEQIIEGLGK